MQGRDNKYVVADAMNLPFEDHSFSHVISSEVLEHLKDDEKALMEIARAIKPKGILIITFPHRHFYFSHDDRFVNHYRRYEISEIVSLLADAGFCPVYIRKVLGLVEKMTMLFATVCASLMEKAKRKRRNEKSRIFRRVLL